ncbi:collagen type IV alpha-3-binding protein-like protein [Aphelenchoides avenae]|nr:collagen type IV alpha-3-binding protein-like protein [Aphelenchus avenae]
MVRLLAPVPQSSAQETASASQANDNVDMTLDASEPPLMAEVRRTREQELKKARAPVGDSEDGMWEIFVEDGSMKMYKMEQEIDGIMCDPLKAVHTVNGVSAWEFIDIFFRPELKPEWDHTLERMNTIEVFNDDLAVIHQIHKRVWPSSQRESLFWSYRSNVSDHRDADAIDAWMVTNHDTERADAPLASSSNIRVQLTVGMYCQTILLPSAAGKTLDQLTRSDIATRVAYIAQVHPGGWAPTAILRQIYKSEYPKFLREFTAYVLKKVKDQPLRLS